MPFGDEEDDEQHSNSKFKRRDRNKKREKRVFENQEQVQEYKDKVNQDIDDKLDQGLRIINETQQIAIDTAQTVHDQGKQLEKIDQDLHDTNQNLDRSNKIIKSMKSWGFNTVGNKKMDKNKYTSPLNNKNLNCVKAGWLYKKGNSFMAKEKHRYCVLTTEKKLYYYETTECTEKDLKGIVDLSRLKFEGIYIDPKNGHKGWFIAECTNRTWYFKAVNEKEANKWIKVIDDVYNERIKTNVFKKVNNEYDNNNYNNKSNNLNNNNFNNNNQQQLYHDQDNEEDNKKKQDEKLDDILKGVKVIGRIANDINSELTRQDIIIDNIDTKMDRTIDRLENQTNQIKRL